MKKAGKFLKVAVENSDLKYGRKHGVSLKQAQDAFIEGFMTTARPQKKTKYRHFKGVDFDFY